MRRAVLPSSWTPLGMVEHLGMVERFWFQQVATGRCCDLPWRTGSDVDPFRSQRPVAQVLAFYREQGRMAARILAETPLDAGPAVTELLPDLAALATSLRSIALHVLEETARHAGHLDAARELIDGRIGLGPR